MHQVQEALHDARSEVCGHSSFGGAGHAGVCLHQGQWESYFHHKIAKVGDDGGPGRAVCRGVSQGALPLAQVQIYSSLGQGMYILKYKIYFLHQ